VEVGALLILKIVQISLIEELKILQIAKTYLKALLV
jgi:hypothetical protein